jgi:hypothetical protein
LNALPALYAAPVQSFLNAGGYAPKASHVSILQIVQVLTEAAIDRRLNFFEPGLPADRVVFVRLVVFKELFNMNSCERIALASFMKKFI